jgi:hypothetical protein
MLMLDRARYLLLLLLQPGAADPVTDSMTSASVSIMLPTVLAWVRCAGCIAAATYQHHT